MTLRGVSAGLHGTVTLTSPGSEREILTLAEQRSVGLHPLSAHCADGAAEGLVLGYSRPPGHAFAGALVRLERLLSDLPAQSD
jgi:GntR family transcriptional regulator/MocR family aminotransferase